MFGFAFLQEVSHSFERVLRTALGLRLRMPCRCCCRSGPTTNDEHALNDGCGAVHLGSWSSTLPISLLKPWNRSSILPGQINGEGLESR